MPVSQFQQRLRSLLFLADTKRAVGLAAVAIAGSLAGAKIVGASFTDFGNQDLAA